MGIDRNVSHISLQIRTNVLQIRGGSWYQARHSKHPLHLYLRGNPQALLDPLYINKCITLASPGKNPWGLEKKKKKLIRFAQSVTNAKIYVSENARIKKSKLFYLVTKK